MVGYIQVKKRECVAMATFTTDYREVIEIHLG